MRKILFTALALSVASLVFAQQDSTRSGKNPSDTSIVTRKKKTAAVSRPGDHFMFQLGYTTWPNKPDSIHTKGFPHMFNAYVLFDFPFKSNQHLSIAIGPGISTDNMYFDKMYVGLKDPGTNLRFQNLADTMHFKKYKLEYLFAEAPIELRYRSNPASDASSFKMAIGVKVGTLLEAHVKGKDWVSSNGSELIAYTQKEHSTRYLNTTRFAGTFRIGYGNFSLFAQYAFTPLFKEGYGPKIQPLTFGLTLSGL
jgi:hypothetical protein